jgi:hypothetical protein
LDHDQTIIRFLCVTHHNLYCCKYFRNSTHVGLHGNRPYTLFAFKENWILQANFIKVCNIRFNENLKSSLLYDIMMCSPLKVKGCFGGTSRLHIQGRRISQTRNQCEACLLELFHANRRTARFRRVLTMVYNTQDYWVFWTFPSYRFLVCRIRDDGKVQKSQKSCETKS